MSTYWLFLSSVIDFYENVPITDSRLSFEEYEGIQDFSSSFCFIIF